MDKSSIRQTILILRSALMDKGQKSAEISDRLLTIPEMKTASTILIYVGTGSEVETRNSITQLMSLGKKVVVPYCQGDILKLFRLNSLDELAQGSYNILEPKKELRTAERECSLNDVSIAVIPGVAFDTEGNRLGMGKGYYDKLLENSPSGTLKVAVLFQCQLVEAVPVEPHDVRMDCLITESGVYRCRTIPIDITPAPTNGTPQNNI